jgi:chromosomal replication initiation ATPase DnaA
MNAAEHQIEQLTARVVRLEMLVGLRATSDGGRQVAVAFHCKAGELRAPTRRMDVVIPRHVFCYLARRTGCTFQSIATMLRRNSATIQHACACIEDRMDTDPEFAARLRQLAGTLEITIP